MAMAANMVQAVLLYVTNNIVIIKEVRSGMAIAGIVALKWSQAEMSMETTAGQGGG